MKQILIASEKFLAQSGLGSRRFCEELIKSKKVKVNGKQAVIGASIEKNDVIEFDGKVIFHTESDKKLLILNKPEGVLSSNKKVYAKHFLFFSLCV